MKDSKNNIKHEWLYGQHAVFAALMYHSDKVKEIRVSASQKHIIDKIKQANKNKLIVVDSNFFNDFPKGHQKIAALVDLNYRQLPLNKLIKNNFENLLLIALDGVTDPQNLGACIRSAKAFNATALLIEKHNNASLTPLVHKVSAGAASCLPIYVVNNLHQTLLGLKKTGIWLFGSSEHASDSLISFKEKKPSLVVFGSEGKGMRPIIRKEMDYLFSIPTNHNFSSLNVGMACCVTLYHFQHISQN